DSPNARRLAPEEVRGEVAFRDVWFRYEEPPPEGSPVSPVSAASVPEETSGQPGPVADGPRERSREWTLAGVNLEIFPGQLAALVGPSGAGKTTTTYLVPRLYDVQKGSVEIDGIDVRDIQLESIGELMGVVTQETYLFHTTIRGNLLQGKPGATQE